MIEYINAIKNFERIIDYKKEGTIDKLYVEAKVNGEVLYNAMAECRFFYDAGYMQQVVEIDWNMNDAEMKKLNLHGGYNTNFQKFELRRNSLILHDKNITIMLTQL